MLRTRLGSALEAQSVIERERERERKRRARASEATMETGGERGEEDSRSEGER